jgi:hypothetical protein
MSPEQNLFRDIAKQVHPDLNGGSVNANEMMKEAIKNRNNVDVLLNLARKWGLKLNGSFDETAFNKRGNTFNEKVFEVVVGAIVKYGFRYKRGTKHVRGVITKIRPITRGHLKGAKEYTIYDFATQAIWKHKEYNTPNYNVVGMASSDDLQLGLDRQKSIKDNKKAVSAHRANIARSKFQSVGLRPNKSYEFSDMMVLVNYKTGPAWKKLVRTTAKCAFIEEYKHMKPRMVKIRSIMDAR